MFHVPVFVKGVLLYQKTFFSLSIYAHSLFILIYIIYNNRYEIPIGLQVVVPGEAGLVSFNIFLTLHRGNEQMEPCTVMCVHW